MQLLISSYTLLDSWLDELLIYLEKNRDFVIEFVNKYIPQLRIIKPEATYILWIDCSKLNIDSQTLVDKIYELGKVRLASGITYGKNADKFIRINIACPKELLEDGLQRIQKTINLLKS